MPVPAAPSPGRAAWLVLTYRLGGSHALKITVRRRLTAIRAVFPVNAVAALPASLAAERAFRHLRRMIGEAGGSAQVLRAEVIEGGADLAAAFNKAREQDRPDGDGPGFVLGAVQRRRPGRYGPSRGQGAGSRPLSA